MAPHDILAFGWIASAGLVFVGCDWLLAGKPKLLVRCISFGNTALLWAVLWAMVYA